jgi:hypothetical protein
VANASRAEPGAGSSTAWPLPERALDHVLLDSPGTTIAYYAGVALVVAGLFVTRFLPCVDYPQHLALADVARRLLDPAAPEHAEYQLNYFTYNGLFHVVVARLSAIVPIEVAGRLVVAASLIATAAAVVALVRVLRRPPAYAALFTPILFSFSVGWGFVNYVFATAIALWALVFVARAAIRPSLGEVGAVAALGMLCAYAHVLAMLILCATAAALAVELACRAASPDGPPGKRALRVLGRVACAGLPLLLGCAYCVAVNHRQYAWDPNMYRDPTMEGSAPPLWEKLLFFGAFATDLFRDATDQVVLWAAIAVMGASAFVVWRERGSGADARAPGDTPPVFAIFALALVGYFATPSVVIGTHLIFQRLAQWVILGALLATPRLSGARLGRARVWALRIGIAAGVNTLVHCGVFGWETADASALIDDLPPGRAASAVIWEPWSIAFRNSTLTHLSGYYAARKHGKWAFAFARYLSVPVRFKEHSQPAWPVNGWEFSAIDYDPLCKYARAFPLVIVKAPATLPVDATGELPVRRLVFKKDASAVVLLSHHGRYWAFDSTGLADDGVF